VHACAMAERHNVGQTLSRSHELRCSPTPGRAGGGGVARAGAHAVARHRRAPALRVTGARGGGAARTVIVAVRA
jgi:hypothetical protein